MANDVELSRLTIEVDAEADSAGKGIDAVASALSHLNAGSRLTRAINNMERLSATLRKFQGLNASANSLTKISVAFQRLSSIQKLTNLSSNIRTLEKFPQAVAGLNSTNLSALASSIQPLTSALGQLGNVEKAAGFNSTLNALNKVPKVVEGLKKVDMDDFARQIERVRTAIAPLAAEMEKVSAGFSALPANIQRAIRANEKLTTSNTKAANSFTILGIKIPSVVAQYFTFSYVITRVSSFLGGALTEFNAFVENVNLFTVSMGEFTKEASDFTQSIQDILGVDASEAMRNMGVIQNLTTSFGVAADQAYVLSKNITQLGYDFASFFNISTEDAFTKLQAAISGELEPIRRLGVDISEARLQQELFALGINASVQNLSQADKALLRYIAIIKQTGNAQTDMARTLNSPANMIRVFQQQVTLLVRSIGSLLIPMLNAVLPPLIAVTQILRELISAFATMIGVTVEFGSVGSSSVTSGIETGLDNVADSASDAAKEMSYLIGGFDELNVMNKDSGSAGSGAGGAGNILGGVDLPEYDMLAGLVESRVSDLVKKIKEFGRNLYDVIKPAIPLLKGLAAGFAAAFAVKAIASFISKLKKFSAVAAGLGVWSDFVKMFKDTDDVIKSAGYAFSNLRKKMSLTTKIMIGAGGFIAAAVSSYDAMKKLGLGTLDAEEAFGSLVLAVGVIGTAMYALLGPVGLVITAVGAAAGGFLGYRDAMQQLGTEMYESTDLHLVMQGIIDRSAESMESAATATQNLKDKISAVSDVTGEYSFARQLADDIFDLSEKTDKSAYEMVELQTKVDILNGLGFDDLQLSLNETGTAVTQVRDSVYQVIDAMEQQALAAAYQDVLTEAYKNQLQSQMDLIQGEKDYYAASEANADARQALSDYYEQLSWTQKGIADLGMDATYNALHDAVLDTSDAFVAAYNSLKDNATLYTESQSAIETYSDYLVALQGATQDTTAMTDEFQTSLENALNIAGMSGSATEEAKTVGGAIADGVAQGISENKGVGRGQILGLTDDVVSTAKDNLGIHSPSTVFADIGMNTVLGFSNAVTEYAPQAVNAVTDMFNTILSRLESFSSRFADGLNQTLSNYASTMSSLYSSGTNVSFSAMPSVSIPRLASGGVLTGPRVVLAGEYAGASSNPEIVAPQSIMRQTVSDANLGMAEMIVAAIQALEQTVIDTSENGTPVVVQLDGDQIYENQRKVAARKGYGISKNSNFSR